MGPKSLGCFTRFDSESTPYENLHPPPPLHPPKMKRRRKNMILVIPSTTKHTFHKFIYVIREHTKNLSLAIFNPKIVKKRKIDVSRSHIYISNIISLTWFKQVNMISSMSLHTIACGETNSEAQMDFFTLKKAAN